MMGQDHEVGSDQTQIIKRKRTKRQRSSSSTFLVAAATTVTSTSSSAGGERSASDESNSALSSPVTTTDCTQEEEDMAICLIMLARGAAPPSPDLKNSRKAEKILHQTTENSSFYVYECKTCSRTFPSFQALGGHRASHKKPRASLDEKAKLPLMQVKSSASEEGQNSHFKVSGPALASKASNIIVSKANKVHECSICGSEFTSGQALGGHMRRHRTATTVASPVPTAEVSTNSTEDLSRSMEQRKYLPLDLNLPAPEDDLRESKFQGIVFSAATPALVDCHY